MTAIPPPLAAAPDPAKTATKATWSLVLGILGMMCFWVFTAIPAIVLGSQAASEARRIGPEARGRGLGVAGIVTGILGLFVPLVLWGIVAGLTAPVVSSVQHRAVLLQQMSEMRQIFIACASYAAEHGGNYPEALADLVPDYLDDEELLYWSVGSLHAAPRPYRYRPGLQFDSPLREPILASPEPLRGSFNVAWTDGRVDQVPQAEFEVNYEALFQD